MRVRSLLLLSAACGAACRGEGAGAVRALAGCYAVGGRGEAALRLRLDTARLGGAYLARALPAPVDSAWSWAPRGADSVEVTWSGIDSGLRLELARDGREFTGTEVRWSANGGGSEERRPVRARQVGCESPAA